MNDFPADSVTIRRAEWCNDAGVLRSIRHTVFIEEQHVPQRIERDGRDPECFHAIAGHPEKGPVGVARMDNTGHIGRMAVLHPWRGRGIGTRIVRFLIELAKARGLDRVDLDSQLDVRAFYERLGFAARGDELGISRISIISRRDVVRERRLTISR